MRVFIMKFLLKMILLSGAMLANGMAMEDPLQNETAVAKNYREAVQEAKSHETDDDRWVLINKLKELGVLEAYRKAGGNVDQISQPVLVVRIHDVFEFYHSYLIKKYPY